MTFQGDIDGRGEADQLYGRIIELLRANKLDDAFRYSEILSQKDYDRERALSISGLVNLQAGKYQVAIDLLERCRTDFGDSPSTLTNLSKSYYSLGQKDLSFDLSKASLQIDPNQHAGLIWYAKLQQERVGSAGVASALEEISKEPGSWRALLWIGRSLLKKGEIGPALELYEKALSIGYDSDALLMISGDLGGSGYPDQAIRLASDKYDPDRDGLDVGVNLLQSYLDIKMREEGEALLSKISKDIGDLGEWYASEFAKIRQP